MHTYSLYRRLARVFIGTSLLGAIVACHGGSPTAATRVTTFSLKGTVYSATAGPQAAVAGARVEVVSGPSAGKNAATDSTGSFELAELLSGAATLRASANGFLEITKDVLVPVESIANLGITRVEGFFSSRVVDAITDAGIGGVMLSGDGIASSTSDGAGNFALSATRPTSGSVALSLTSPSIVERHVTLRLPGAQPSVPVIPAAFDLSAFNEMFRVTQLQRWRNAPPLVIETSALQFVEREAQMGTTIDDRLSPAEYDSLVTDLLWALPQLSGGQFTGFASLERRDTPTGTSLTMFNNGVITVYRYAGLRQALGTVVGLGNWRFQSDGTIVGGAIWLDRDFDRADPRKRSVRAHELGHAMGYQHVATTPSVMNPQVSSNYDITDFDRQASRIAFQRPPGNTAPDNDPPAVFINAVGTERWSVPVP